MTEQVTPAPVHTFSSTAAIACTRCRALIQIAYLLGIVRAPEQVGAEQALVDLGLQYRRINVRNRFLKGIKEVYHRTDAYQVCLAHVGFEYTSLYDAVRICVL